MSLFVDGLLLERLPTICYIAYSFLGLKYLFHPYSSSASCSRVTARKPLSFLAHGQGRQLGMKLPAPCFPPVSRRTHDLSLPLSLLLSMSNNPALPASSLSSLHSPPP